MGDAFDDMADINPFADPSVIAASKYTKMEMSDEQKTKAGNGAESGPSFSASRPVNPKGITAELDTYMQKEEALRIREERLRMRESEIERAHPSGYKPPNFPPLPHWFPIAPCFYINIEEEIPAQNTALCRQLYIKLMAYSLMQILNVLAMIFILMGLDNSLSPFIASVIICILFVPGSFLFCFRSGYIALKSNSSFYYYLYFISAGVEIFLHLLQLLGINGNAWAGFSNGGRLFDQGYKFGGIVCIILGFVYTGFFFYSIYLLRLMQMSYKLSGANLQKAQSEFGAGVWKRGGAELLSQAFSSPNANIP